MPDFTKHAIALEKIDAEKQEIQNEIEDEIKRMFSCIEKTDRHSIGFERRLQVFMQSNKPVAQLMNDIEINGIPANCLNNLKESGLSDLQFLGKNEQNH